MVTARTGEADKIAMGSGVGRRLRTKPFSPRELKAGESSAAAART
jgi:DNA-binding response OmpR family regulator